MDWGTLATIGITGLVTIGAATIAPIATALSERQRRRDARRETLADLSAELLQRCREYRGAARDVPLGSAVMDMAKMTARSPEARNRDDASLRMDAALVRVIARDRKLAPIASQLVDAARSDDDWDGAREAFMTALTKAAKA